MDLKRWSIELQKYYHQPDSFWGKISGNLREQLEERLITKNYAKKEVIYSEGSYPRGLYIVRKGMAKVSIVDNNGTEQIIYFLGRDEVFGHRLIVSDDASPVFITAIEACTIDCIPRIELLKFLYESTELSTLFLNYMGNEFRVFVNKISLFSQKSASERVALALLVLYDKFHRETDLAQALIFTRGDLANYIGIATENLIRQLKSLSDQGMIELQGKKIFIKHFEALFKQANIM